MRGTSVHAKNMAVELIRACKEHSRSTSAIYLCMHRKVYVATCLSYSHTCGTMVAVVPGTHQLNKQTK